MASHPPTEISYSNGGGFSGLVSGMTLTPDGYVLQWHGRPGTRDNLDTLARMNTAQHRELLDAIYDLHPSEIRHQESGNMTTALTMTSGDELWTWTWPGMRGDDAAVPESLRGLRDLIWNAMQSVGPAHE